MKTQYFVDNHSRIEPDEAKGIPRLTDYFGVPKARFNRACTLHSHAHAHGAQRCFYPRTENQSINTRPPTTLTTSRDSEKSLIAQACCTSCDHHNHGNHGHPRNFVPNISSILRLGGSICKRSGYVRYQGPPITKTIKLPSLLSDGAESMRSESPPGLCIFGDVPILSLIHI